MKKEVYLTILFDYYGELFTEKQQNYFKDYYHANLSLSEISENNNVSRNAVHKQIKSIETKLYFYEKKLKLYQKDLLLKEIISIETDNKIKKDLEKVINM